MTHTSTEQPSLAAIIHDLRESHARTSPGTWGKGATTHETVSRAEGREPYKVAEFRHANDAQFCDLAHVFVPRLLSEIEALQSRILELEASKSQRVPLNANQRQAPIKMHPGDDLHLTVLMASHGLNFVTGKDREQLLAWGRDVWQAARSAPAVPHTKVKPDFYWDSEKQHHVPTLLIEFEPVPAGEPCDAKGWTDRDNLAAMLAADALDGLLARDLNEDTDPDDGAFDDFAEDVEDNECSNCSGTGEGMYDGQSCVVCRGKGFL